jgi:hypothetical protein
MILRAALIGAVVGGVAWAQTTPKEGVIDPKANIHLQRMSQYLNGLESFRVDATTIDEKVTTNGQKIQEVKESQLAVKRPNKLRVDRTGPRGHAVFRYDGEKASLYSAEQNLYAMGPAPGDLEDFIDHARDRFHVDAPGGDLLVPNSYESLTQDVKEGRYIGLEPIGGKMAHHLAMTGKEVDWQIWIADGPQPVPLRYVITTKTMESQPQYTLEAATTPSATHNSASRRRPMPRAWSSLAPRKPAAERTPCTPNENHSRCSPPR